MVQEVKNLPTVQETRVRSLGWQEPLEKGMATHSSIFAWRIPCTEEPGGVTESQTQLTLLLGLVREVTVVLKFGESSGYCRGPAPADPGSSKERRRRQGSGNNCLIKR